MFHLPRVLHYVEHNSCQPCSWRTVSLTRRFFMRNNELMKCCQRTIFNQVRIFFAGTSRLRVNPSHLHGPHASASDLISAYVKGRNEIEGREGEGRQRRYLPPFPAGNLPESLRSHPGRAGPQVLRSNHLRWYFHFF